MVMGSLNLSRSSVEWLPSRDRKSLQRFYEQLALVAADHNGSRPVAPLSKRLMLA